MSRAMQHELLCSPDRWQPSSPEDIGRWETYRPDWGFIAGELVPVAYDEDLAAFLREEIGE